MHRSLYLGHDSGLSLLRLLELLRKGFSGFMEGRWFELDD